MTLNSGCFSDNLKPMNDSLVEAVENYSPSRAVLDKLHRIKLIAVVGSSAAGKTSIIERALKASSDMRLVGGETSRSPRPGEKEDFEYRFKTKEQMLDTMRRGEYVQIELGKTGDLYSSRPEDYPIEGTGIIAIWSTAVPKFRQLFKNMYTVFIVPDSFDDWQQRFAERIKDTDDEEKAKRLAEAKQSYEFALNDHKVIFLLNDELDKAAERILQVAQGNQPDDEELARQTAAQHYKKLAALPL